MQNNLDFVEVYKKNIMPCYSFCARNVVLSSRWLSLLQWKVVIISVILTCRILKLYVYRFHSKVSLHESVYSNLYLFFFYLLHFWHWLVNSFIHLAFANFLVDGAIPLQPILSSMNSMEKIMNMKLQSSFWINCCIQCHNHQMNNLLWSLKYVFCLSFLFAVSPKDRMNVRLSLWHFEGARGWYQHWIWRYC